MTREYEVAWMSRQMGFGLVAMRQRVRFGDARDAARWADRQGVRIFEICVAGTGEVVSREFWR